MKASSFRTRPMPLVVVKGRYSTPELEPRPHLDRYSQVHARDWEQFWSVKVVPKSLFDDGLPSVGDLEKEPSLEARYRARGFPVVYAFVGPDEPETKGIVAALEKVSRWPWP